MSFYHSPKIVTDGLVVSLDAGNTKSYPGTGTVWFDRSGNSNNGTLTNGPTFSQANLGSIQFDGADDYVQSNLKTNIDEKSMTISFFFRNNSSDEWRDFISLATTGNKSLVFERGGVNGEPQTTGFIKAYPVEYTTSLVDVFVPGFFVNDTKIHFISLTASNTEWNLYSENGRYASGSVSGTTNYFNRLAVGTDITRGGRFSKMNSYSVQLYNRALSAQEIQQNFNALRGRFGI